MKKICFDARMIEHSGVGTYIKNVIPMLAGYYELILLENKNKLDKYFSNLSCAVKIFDSNIYSFSEQISYPLITPKCDLFIAPHFNAPIFPIRAKKRITVIHDVFHLAFKNNFSFLKRFYSSLLINSAIKLSDKIITVSNFSKKEILTYTNCNENKIKRIYIGVDDILCNKKTDMARLEAIKEKYSLKDNFILYVGNVKPHKNLKTLLKALKLLINSGFERQLTIVGKKEGFITGDREIYNFIKNDKTLEKHVVFTGFISEEELSIIYNLCGVLAFPSYYEGFGLPPVEAMKCGRPAVVSNAASMPEICGDAVLYFNPDDHIDLAQKLKLILTNSELTTELIQKGKQRAEAFSWKLYKNEFLELIDLTLSYNDG